MGRSKSDMTDYSTRLTKRVRSSGDVEISADSDLRMQDSSLSAPVSLEALARPLIQYSPMSFAANLAILAADTIYGPPGYNITEFLFPDQTRDTIVTGVYFGMDDDDVTVSALEIRVSVEGVLQGTLSPTGLSQTVFHQSLFDDPITVRPGERVTMAVARTNGSADSCEFSAGFIYYYATE